MLTATSNVNLNQKYSYKPSFGSVVLSRVVLRTVDKNGNIFYTPILNNEKGIKGIYQALSRRVNSAKNNELLKKLSEAITDFKTNNPIIYSTIINVRSSFKRFLLTGSDARMARDMGTDLIGAMNNRRAYANVIKDEILNNPKKRVFNADGDEIGIDLIVEGPRGKRKLINIEISTLQGISKAKPPKFASNKKEIAKLNNINVTPQCISQPTTLHQVQSEFDFVSELKPKKINPRDYD